MFSDGKWKLDQGPSPSAQQEAVFQSPVKRIVVKYRPEDWNLLPKRERDEFNKRTLAHRSLPVYGLIISDEIPATNDQLKSAIVNNAKSAATSVDVILDEPRQVRGTNVGHIRLMVAANGMEYVFSTYYYADGDGNIQLACYTARQLFFKYQSECQKLLDGLVISQK